MLNFPGKLRLTVTYYPIQFEPITHSGERITIVVAVVCDGEEPIVEVSINELCLQGTGLYEIATETSIDLNTHLQLGKDVRNWRPVFDRVKIGEKRETAADTMKGALCIAMMNTACFSPPRHIINN